MVGAAMRAASELSPFVAVGAFNGAAGGGGVGETASAGVAGAAAAAD
jgi:hypothetical protein